MSALSWAAVLAVLVGANLFGQTARGVHLADPPRERIGVALSRSGPVLAFVVGLAAAALSGAWLPMAVGTAAAVVLTATAGAVLAPG